MWYWQFPKSSSSHPYGPLQDQKECYTLRNCLVGARRMIMIYGRAGISADGEFSRCIEPDMRCMVEEKETKGQRKFFMFKLLLSCHKILIFFNTSQRAWRPHPIWWPFFWNSFHELWITLGRSRVILPVNHSSWLLIRLSAFCLIRWWIAGHIVKVVSQ